MMKPLFILLAASLASMGCSRRPDPQPVSLRGVSYEFPRGDIESYNSESEGTLFVRLRSPGSDFDLILDELSHYAANNQGSGVPTISRVNSNLFATFQVINSPVGLVICGGDMPHFNCGFRINDGPVRWSVIFDRDRLPQVKRMRAQAEAAIRSYHAGG